jgi:vacuolar-type H+-ATPase subunit H
MAGPRATTTPEAAVEDAIGRVLLAEAEARAAVARCESEAAQIVVDARARARRVAERTEARIQRLRSAYAAAAQTRLDGIRAAEAALGSDASDRAALAARLDAAVAAVVEELAGGRRP